MPGLQVRANPVLRNLKLIKFGGIQEKKFKYSFPNFIKTQDHMDTFLRGGFSFIMFLVYLFGPVAKQAETH